MPDPVPEEIISVSTTLLLQTSFHLSPCSERSIVSQFQSCLPLPSPPLYSLPPAKYTSPPVQQAAEAEFLDEIQTKGLRVFLLSFHPLQLCLEIFISSNSRNLLHISTVQLLYTVQEKGEKPDGKPYLLPYGLRNPRRNLKFTTRDYSQKFQRNCTFMHELGFNT